MHVCEAPAVEASARSPRGLRRAARGRCDLLLLHRGGVEGKGHGRRWHCRRPLSCGSLPDPSPVLPPPLAEPLEAQGQASAAEAVVSGRAVRAA